MKQSINTKLLDLRGNVDSVLNQLSQVTGNEEESKKNLQEEMQELQNILSAMEIVQKVSQFIQQKAHDSLAKVVTACLQDVFFDEDYEFQIQFEKKRNKTEAKLVFLKDGHEIEDPINEDSGGVVEVAAFVLRLSCLLLSKPPVRKLMVMDEPFKFVSEEYQENVRVMIEKLAEDFGVQFIIVTHIKSLVTGKVVKL